MKQIDLLIDGRAFMGATCNDDEVQAIADWFKRSDVIDSCGNSIKSATKLHITDVPNPKPQPTAVPTRKEIKLVEFLNWGKKL